MRCTTRPERLADYFTVLQAAWTYRTQRVRLGMLEALMLVGHELKT